MEKQPILSIENLTVKFDRFVAVNGVSFGLANKELRFLIGPNGAGKTTVLDAICGKVKPVQGSIRLQTSISADLVKMHEHQIAQLGIGRKFQTPTIFSNLTVFENLELTLPNQRGLWNSLTSKLRGEEREATYKQLEMMELADKAACRAGILSHGEKQWLEIGMVLMQNPRVILLDEPVAGMSKSETDKTGQILQRIASSCSVLVVEHDMEFVRKYAHAVTVMHEGKILCEGLVEDVQNDPKVAEVYLGRRRDPRAAS